MIKENNEKYIIEMTARDDEKEEILKIDSSLKNVSMCTAVKYLYKWNSNRGLFCELFYFRAIYIHKNLRSGTR